MKPIFDRTIKGFGSKAQVGPMPLSMEMMLVQKTLTGRLIFP